MIIKFKVFEEVRLEDVLQSKNDYINSFKKDFSSSVEFINSIRIGNKFYKIEYNHNINHDLKNRIKDRTSLKGIDEFNTLFKMGLEYLFSNEYEESIKSYALIFKEYNFTVIINVKPNIVKVATLLTGSDVTVGKKVNLECTL